jgi:hypothetical protein
MNPAFSPLSHPPRSHQLIFEMNLSRLINPIISASDMGPDFDSSFGIYKGYGKYANAHGHPIISSGTGICLGGTPCPLHFEIRRLTRCPGGFSGKAYLKKGTLLGKEITYISKM